MLTDVLSLALTLLAALLVGVAAYLALLSLAAILGRPRRPAPGPGQRRFAILVPAHNEERHIGRLLDSLGQLDYPAHLVDVYVVADNCDDTTADRARAAGARVFERVDDTNRAKGFALRWLIDQIRDSGERYGAFVVFDADSVVEPNFLSAMDARLEGGSQVVQAYYSVLNSGESPVATLRFTALAAVHYLRPLGRSVLGLSVGLKGNGMCFAAPVIDQFAWRWFTLAEDVEFHLALVRAGIRVDFAPETRVLADMPVTLAQATSQNDRWERGRLQLLRAQGVELLSDVFRHRRLLVLDALVEQLLPPLSVPFVLGCATLLTAIALQAPTAAAMAAISLAGQVAYLVASLILVRAPWSAYRALSFAPVYAIWKIGLYARAMVARGRESWVRTARTAE